MISLTDDKVYITYLSKEQLPFNKENIHTVIGDRGVINKPLSAWWGSPADAIFGWKEWCECENFCFKEYDWEHPIKWKLKPNCKIIKIDHLDVMNTESSVLKDYAKTNDIFKNTPLAEYNLELDFQAMLDNDIVAVELLDARIGHMFMTPLEKMFNTWDCESIVVLDESKIEFI